MVASRCKTKPCSVCSYFIELPLQKSLPIRSGIPAHCSWTWPRLFQDPGTEKYYNCVELKIGYILRAQLSITASHFIGMVPGGMSGVLISEDGTKVGEGTGVGVGFAVVGTT